MAQKEKMYLGFLVSFSIPGYQGFRECPKSDEYWNLVDTIKISGIACNSVDTMPGWWNLNQDWVQIYTPMEGLEQGWCLGLTDWWPAELKKFLEESLKKGSIIMMVDYITAARRVPKKTKKNYSEFKQRLFEKVSQGFDSNLFKEYGIKYESYH